MQNHVNSVSAILQKLQDLEAKVEGRLAQNNQQLQRMQGELTHYLNIIDTLNEVFVSYNREGIITLINKRTFDLTGFCSDEMLGFPLLDFVEANDHSVVKAAMSERLDRISDGTYEMRIRLKDGTYRLVRVRASSIVENDCIVGGAVLGEDITEKRMIEEAYRTIFENTGTAMMILDTDTTVKMINRQFEEYTGYSKSEVENRMSWTTFVANDDLERMKKYHFMRRVDEARAPRNYEFKMKSRTGEFQDIFLSIAMLPGTEQSIVSLMDITDLKRTERELVHSRMELEAAYEELIATEEELRNQFLELQQKEKELRYISQHDPLTGLYNRHYYELEIQRLEREGFERVALVLFDIDGLKLVNDSRGHEHGDRMLVTVAGIIAECCREDNLLARVGGDEFALVIKDASVEPPADIVRQVKRSVRKYNEEHGDIPLSVSIGYSNAGEGNCAFADLFKEADNYMQHRKLHSARSARSSIVSTLVSTLGARDFITEGHTDRMQSIVATMGRYLGLSERAIDDLKLLARFHDIGKVGIPDRILFKEGRLELDEIVEMRRHSEIGYKIAQAAGELVHISEWILMHHEWWNGNGYPLGIKGDDIPIECRVLAIADAYDAMTNDRPYRQALSSEDAICELYRCSGTQFDPALIDIFCQVALEP